MSGLTKPREKEPVALFDTTGSLMKSLHDGTTNTWADVVTKTARIFVEKLGAVDSQAENELEGEGGGLLTYTFAGLPDARHPNGGYRELGDINPKNFDQKWQVTFDGRTFIMGAFQDILEKYKEEFADRPQAERPILGVLTITDGELEDQAEFEAALRQAGGDLEIVIGVVGSGDAHDKALGEYTTIASRNHNVKVVTFKDVTDAESIATTMLSMLE